MDHVNTNIAEDYIMKATIKFGKPKVVTAPTKTKLMEKITQRGGYHYVFGFLNGGKFNFSVLVDSRQSHYRVYNAEKFRRKASPDKKTVVREGHWVAYVYDIPIDFLSSATRGHLKQNSRNFTLTMTIK